MKKILFVALILANLTNAQTDFNKGFDEYKFGSSFDSIVQKLTKKHFVSLTVEYHDAWQNVFNRSYVVLDCAITDSTAKEWLTFEFFNDSLFVIKLGGTDSFRDYMDNQLKFIFQMERPLFEQPRSKYPQDVDDFYSVGQVRIKFSRYNPRYEIRLKSIEAEYNEIAKKAEQIRQTGR